MSSLEISTSRFGLLNSESNWADEVANVFLLLMQVLVKQEFACLPRGATYYASSSFRSNESEAPCRNGCTCAGRKHRTERGSAGSTSHRTHEDDGRPGATALGSVHAGDDNSTGGRKLNAVPIRGVS